MIKTIFIITIALLLGYAIGQLQYWDGGVGTKDQYITELKNDRDFYQSHKLIITTQR